LELWSRANGHSVFRSINEPLLFYREFGGDYYKKYQKGIKSFFYVSKKRFNNGKYYDSAIWAFNGGMHIFKYIIYRVMNWFDKEGQLVRKRSLSLESEEERIMANSCLSRALKNKK
jgi:hypothetical protein